MLEVSVNPTTVYPPSSRSHLRSGRILLGSLLPAILQEIEELSFKKKINNNVQKLKINYSNANFSVPHYMYI